MYKKFSFLSEFPPEQAAFSCCRSKQLVSNRTENAETDKRTEQKDTQGNRSLDRKLSYQCCRWGDKTAARIKKHCTMRNYFAYGAIFRRFIFVGNFAFFLWLIQYLDNFRTKPKDYSKKNY